MGNRDGDGGDGEGEGERGSGEELAARGLGGVKREPFILPGGSRGGADWPISWLLIGLSLKVD